MSVPSTTDTGAKTPRVSTENTTDARTGASPHAQRQDARSAALGTYRTVFHPSDDEGAVDRHKQAEVEAFARLQKRRRVRFARRTESSRILIEHARREAGLPDNEGFAKPARPGRCSFRIHLDVGVHHDGRSNDRAHFSGLMRCGSVWACPVCSSVIRGDRAEEIRETVRLNQEADGGVVFVTATLRHKSQDSLERSLDAALKGWRALMQGKAWKSFSARWDVRGVVRALEVTYGDNGWHPHVHAIFLTGGKLPDEAAREWKKNLFPRWARAVERFGGRMPSKLRGLDVQIANEDGEVLATYMSKMQDEGKRSAAVDLGLELARGDLKDARSSSIVPFQLLDPGVRDYTPERRAELWVEYVAATKGRRMLTWSVGLRAALGQEVEKTDEQILEEAEQSEEQFRIHGKVYDSMRQKAPELLPRILEMVEAELVQEAVEKMLAWYDVNKDTKKHPPRARVIVPEIEAIPLELLPF